MYKSKVAIDFNSHRYGVFGTFADEYFPEFFGDLDIKLSESDLDFDSLNELIINNLTYLSSVPEGLQQVVSNNIHSLAIQYQIYWVSSLVHVFANKQNFGKFNNDIFSIEYDSFINKIGSSKDKNSKVVKKHVETAVKNFFPDVEKERLKVGSVDFTNNIPLFYFLEPLQYVVKDSAPYYVKADIEVKNLHDMKIPYSFFGPGSGKKVTPKFNILTHPFVFGVNCMYFHRKIYVLSLNTSKDFSYIVHVTNPHTNPEDYYSEATALLNDQISIEDYISNFVKNYSGVLQREDNNIAPILYGIYMESQQQARACIYKMWSDYCREKIKENVSNSLISFNNHSNAILKNSGSLSFGWS